MDLDYRAPEKPPPPRAALSALAVVIAGVCAVPFVFACSLARDAQRDPGYYVNPMLLGILFWPLCAATAAGTGLALVDALLVRPRPAVAYVGIACNLLMLAGMFVLAWIAGLKVL